MFGRLFWDAGLGDSGKYPKSDTSEFRSAQPQITKGQGDYSLRVCWMDLTMEMLDEIAKEV
jgi:hypothetical protein